MSNPGTWSHPETLTLVNEMETQVVRFLDTLNETSRSLVWLRYREDLGLGDIARITGRPLGSIKTDFTHIRKQMEHWWKKEVDSEL